MIHIIFAGILAIPSLLVSIVFAIIIAILSIPSVFLLLFRKPSIFSYKTTTNTTNTNNTKKNYHIIITGGSSGIGLCIAKQCILRNDVSKITILARNQKRLDDTKQLLEDLLQQQQQQDNNNNNTNNTIIIQIKSVSVSDPIAIEQCAHEICNTSSSNTTTTTTIKETMILFLCAGTSYTTYYDDISTDQYLNLIQTNQLGVMYCVKAFLPYMKNINFTNGGRIIITSSAAGQLGIFGYSIYSPTKFALRGFAEALHSELVPYENIFIQLTFPADTDTPGYEKELQLMPKETKALNESAGLANPNVTAKIMIKEALKPNPKFLVYFNLEGWMLSNLTAGMTPVTSMDDAITQIALSNVLRFISLFYLNDFWRIITNFAKEDEKKEKKEKEKEEGSTKSKDD